MKDSNFEISDFTLLKKSDINDCQNLNEGNIMRKYRAWDKINKVMLQVERLDLINDEYDTERIFVKCPHCNNGYWMNDPLEFDLMESTELPDINKIEIYRGDYIVFLGERDEQGNVIPPKYVPHEVAWSMGGFHAIPVDKMMDSSGKYWKGVGCTNSKIIGNIYEGINDPQFDKYKDFILRL